MKVLISPYSKNLPNGKPNAKNFPHWQEVVNTLLSNGIEVIQVGLPHEPALDGCTQKRVGLAELKDLLLSCDGWASVDNFFHHFAAYHGRRGVVVFGKSDPQLFGYPENVNLLKDRRNLRAEQWKYWYEEPFDEKVFVGPQLVAAAIIDLLRN
jgi:ADP-heptose:LPS heptosyltransferase